MDDNLETRMTRVKAAINLEESDRIPVSLAINYKFPCRYKGISQGEYFRNRSLGAQAMREVFDELGGWDIVAAGGTTTQHRDLVEAPMIIKVPGRDIGEDEVIQWEEAEVFTEKEYDRIIEMGWIDFMKDFYPRFRGWDPEIYHSRMETRAARELDALKNSQNYFPERGYPIYGGSDVFPPMMMLSCSRSMTKFAMDIHRIPDKVKAVMDAMVGDLTRLAIEGSKMAGLKHPWGIPTCSLIMERGGAFYFPLKVFEVFELPYIKEIVEGLIAEGITPILHFDQDWTANMPYLKELPKGKFFIQLDSKTDIFKTKEVLKDHTCIMGDVHPSLLSLGTPDEVAEYCRKLIDVVGTGGGFILGVGCGVPIDAKFENLKAMVDTARDYRTIRTEV